MTQPARPRRSVMWTHHSDTGSEISCPGTIPAAVGSLQISPPVPTRPWYQYSHPPPGVRQDVHGVTDYGHWKFAFSERGPASFHPTHELDATHTHDADAAVGGPNRIARTQVKDTFVCPSLSSVDRGDRPRTPLSELAAFD